MNELDLDALGALAAETSDAKRCTDDKWRAVADAVPALIERVRALELDRATMHSDIEGWGKLTRDAQQDRDVWRSDYKKLQEKTSGWRARECPDCGLGRWPARDGGSKGSCETCGGVGYILEAPDSHYRQEEANNVALRAELLQVYTECQNARDEADGLAKQNAALRAEVDRLRTWPTQCKTCRHYTSELRLTYNPMRCSKCVWLAFTWATDLWQRKAKEPMVEELMSEDERRADAVEWE
jgi:predicted Zn-ribbon and HTH transcriptional regulator